MAASEPEHDLNHLKEEHCKGIRIKSFKRLIKVHYLLNKKYNNLKKDKPRYIDYISSMDRIEDIEKILKCSERTARDYRDALIYFSND